ncbi:winged helix-turn-helix domain-containing protein [Campylobacterota bacterium DY0563]|uniref:winged helix-turn-helix transcriptional regulator n=1 Tax=Halarcobacter sp. TaxID=2321133 RepID=UPI0029F4A6F2|nr:winged helix-turn-helix domain-containing protein [Halarcobacter sp.]
MRLLSLNINKEVLDYIIENELYICDDVSEIDDAIYHSEVRYYNIILVKHNNTKYLKQILKYVNPRQTAVIFLVDEISKEEELELLKKGAIDVLKGSIPNDLLLAKMKSIHRENFENQYIFKDKYLINKEERSISDNKNNKLVINGKPFSILEYLIKNRHRSAISKEELLDVLWDDPEWVVRNVVEVNINIIRKGIQNTFEENFINTVRHRGYQIV